MTKKHFDVKSTAAVSGSDSKPEPPEKVTKQGLCAALKNVSVEPILFLHTVGLCLGSVITQNLFIERICRVGLNHTRDECHDLLLNKAGNITLEVEIATAVTKYSLYQTYVLSFVPIIFIIFLGPYCDKRGSKVPLLLAIFGFTISGVCIILFCYFDHLPPVYLLVAYLPVTLTGGSVVICIAALSYISVVTTSADRSVRFALMEVCWILGAPVGMLGGAKLYKVLGFMPIFCISTAFYATSFLLGIFILKGSPNSGKDSKGFLRDVFDLSAIKDTLRVVFIKREPPKRTWLLVCFLILVLKGIAGSGISHCLFLFTRRQFSWNEQHFATFTTVDTFMMIGGLLIMTFVGLKWLKLSDIVLAIVSTLTSIGFCAIVAVAPHDPSAYWLMYLAITIQMFGGMTGIMVRAMFAKIASDENVGKIFTFVIVIEIAIIPLGAGTMFAYIYIATMTTFPGAFSVISGGIQAVVLLLILYLYYSVRTTEKKKVSV